MFNILVETLNMKGGNMNVVEPIRSLRTIKTIKKILLKTNKRDLLIFTLGINSGLRISDILALNVEDVRNKTHINIIEKKTGKTKKFPLNPHLKILIDEFITGRKDFEPLFLTKSRRRLDRTQCYRIINRVCQMADINYKVGTHTLRKTFGYHHYKKFKDVVILQKIFNHSTPEITLRYIGINQDIIDKSYNSFNL